MRVRCRIRRIRVGESRIRKEKVADLKLSGQVSRALRFFYERQSTRLRPVKYSLKEISDPFSYC